MSLIWEGKKLEVWKADIWKFPDNWNQTWCPVEPYFESVYQTHDLNIHFGNSFYVRFVTQLQIWKISIKSSKEWTLMFLLWGCLSDTWFEYSFRNKQFLCQICHSASNLKDFYQDIYSMYTDVFILRVFTRHMIWILILRRNSSVSDL